MRTLILIIAIVLLYWILRWQYRKDPTRFTKNFLKWGGITLLLVLVLLVVTGRLHWLFAAIAGLFTLAGKAANLLRYLPMIATLKRFMSGQAQAQSQGQPASVETRFLRVQLNPQTGELSGTVLTGEHSGATLAELTQEQLLQLLESYRREDMESASLLATFLAHRFGGGKWKGGAFQQPRDNLGEGMSRQQALDILGLSEPVNAEVIIKAHRQLIQKLHPDRGGSNYLAAKINAAKDFLLDEHSKGDSSA